MFTTTMGTAWDAPNLRDEFQDLCSEAGLGRDWVPCELRHTFVSVLSANDVPICPSLWPPVWPHPGALTTAWAVTSPQVLFGG